MTAYHISYSVFLHIKIFIFPHIPERYKILNNSFHLPPRESDDPAPAYDTPPGGAVYVHSAPPDEWSL